jgi:hypothetical protein
MKFLGVPGAFDYTGPTRARAIAIVRVAFRTCLLRRRPGCIFSQLHLPPRLFPCLRFTVHLAMPIAKLGAKVDRYSFFVRLLPSSASYRFSPAHKHRDITQNRLCGSKREMADSVN